jgi:hypothetical protein
MGNVCFYDKDLFGVLKKVFEDEKKDGVKELA